MNEIFYSLGLFLIYFISKMVENTIKSVFDNLPKLIYTLCIMLIVINTFSFFIAERFRNQLLQDGSIESPDLMCNSYWGCLINNTNIGIRAGGGIADFMNKIYDYR